MELILRLKIYLTANYTQRIVSTFVMLVEWKLETRKKSPCSCIPMVKNLNNFAI